MHCVVRSAGQADQVPEAIGVFRKLLGWPDVVHRSGFHHQAVSFGLLTAMAVTPQRLLPQTLPPAVAAAVVKRCHANLQRKQKTARVKTHKRFNSGRKGAVLGYSRELVSCTFGNKATIRALRLWGLSLPGEPRNQGNQAALDLF